MISYRVTAPLCQFKITGRVTFRTIQKLGSLKWTNQIGEGMNPPNSPKSKQTKPSRPKLTSSRKVRPACSHWAQHLRNFKLLIKCMQIVNTPRKKAASIFMISPQSGRMISKSVRMIAARLVSRWLRVAFICPRIGVTWILIWILLGLMKTNLLTLIVRPLLQTCK